MNKHNIYLHKVFRFNENTDLLDAVFDTCNKHNHYDTVNNRAKFKQKLNNIL